ncbi:thiamine phosphate synthase [Chitinophaga sp. HK235]|uniref:thiamine phosphate synthase n=1 Tax=Chitinophaga sp. HK235 TaxID=2952571 RepID=UPI001BA59590|nr:thiamine phosphate synthase [Chitinophaga sp. HK235]
MIWIITSPERIYEEEKIIADLLQAGAHRILLRKPSWQPREYMALLDKTDPSCYARIIVRDNFQVCQRFPVGGLHLSGKVRESMNCRELQLCLQRYRNCSTGIHDMADITSMAPQFTTLLLSPVFDSISKAGYNGRFAQPLPDKKGRQVLGMGGIDASNISRLKDWHYDGAALLGAIWQQPEQAVNNYQRIQAQWNSNDHP